MNATAAAARVTAPRAALSRGSGLRAKQRETTVTQAQLHVCIRSIAVLSSIEKKERGDLARDTAQARKFFIQRGLKKW